jgi:hypothetical protein
LNSKIDRRNREHIGDEELKLLTTIALAGYNGISFDDLYGKLGDIFLDEDVLWVHLAGLKTSGLAEEYKRDGKPFYRATELGKKFGAWDYVYEETDDGTFPPIKDHLSEKKIE